MLRRRYGWPAKQSGETKARGAAPKPYDYMFLTNIYMLATALVFALCRGEVQDGLKFALDNRRCGARSCASAPARRWAKLHILYDLDLRPAQVCTTVTTTRKIFSCFSPCLLKGHGRR